jgi:uncharacterized protein YuzE
MTAAMSFDADADAAYLTLSDGRVVRTEEVADGIQIDYDATDQPVGIEVLSVKRRLGAGDLASYAGRGRGTLGAEAAGSRIASRVGHRAQFL